MSDFTLAQRQQLHETLVRRGGAQHSETNVKGKLPSLLTGWRLTVPYLRDLEGDITAWQISRVTTYYGMYSFRTRADARRARDELARLGFVAYVGRPIEGDHSHV